MQGYIKERYLETELWTAIEEQNKQKVLKLIKNGCDLNGNRGASFEEGITFLMVAVMSGNYKIVKLLVQSGANVNVESIYGDSALFNAVASNYQEIINYLEPLTTDKNIKAAVDKYRFMGFLETVSVLNQRGFSLANLLTEFCF